MVFHRENWNIVPVSSYSVQGASLEIQILQTLYLNISCTFQCFNWTRRKKSINDFLITYHISSYSFHRNYSFWNLEIQRSQYLRPKVTVHKCVETIQGQKLYEEVQYVELFFQMKSIESVRNYIGFYFEILL